MGGKTATIKTLGLAVLMHQCGMYVAAASARLPVVRDVLVDIGDEQSIEASLSTFASHLKHLRYVLRHAAPDTLVLVDELGSGTDPNEGAALAQALIECLLTQDARGVITSHLSPLKLFALETPGLKNASMGFDVETLAPTYVLQVGQPGRSFALAIAQRMGLPADVLGRAEELLGPDAGLMERMLEGLERERTDLRAQLDATAAAKRDAEAELGRVRQERETLEARRARCSPRPARRPNRCTPTPSSGCGRCGPARRRTAPARASCRNCANCALPRRRPAPPPPRARTVAIPSGWAAAWTSPPTTPADRCSNCGATIWSCSWAS